MSVMKKRSVKIGKLNMKTNNETGTAQRVDDRASFKLHRIIVRASEAVISKSVEQNRKNRDRETKTSFHIITAYE